MYTPISFPSLPLSLASLSLEGVGSRPRSLAYSRYACSHSLPLPLSEQLALAASRCERCQKQGNLKGLSKCSKYHSRARSLVVFLCLCVFFYGVYGVCVFVLCGVYGVWCVCLFSFVLSRVLCRYICETQQFFKLMLASLLRLPLILRYAHTHLRTGVR